MEDVLAVYTRPHDAKRPLVCLDEAAKQLTAETRAPISMAPGRPARHDYEYKRNGTASLFMLFAPLEGWRHVTVIPHRAAIDYAHVLKQLSDVHSPKAETIVLVQDNLNTLHPRLALSGLPARRSTTDRQPFRVALHAQARQLAQHGGSGIVRPRPAMPRPAYPRHRNPRRAGRGLAATAQQTSHQRRLAVYNQRRPDQVEKPIPRTLDDSDY